ncbi:retrovirus-related pol polyprotein from transposon TNT 1-94 [Tanacetum coccineum]
MLSALRRSSNENLFELMKSNAYVYRKDLILQLEILSKEILLKWNLPDHRSILTYSKMVLEVPFQLAHKFIAASHNVDLHFIKEPMETPYIFKQPLALMAVRNDLLTGYRGTYLYSITLQVTTSLNLITNAKRSSSSSMNDVVERQSRTLIEATRTMLSAAKLPLFFWAEAIETACFTQNHSLVIPRHEKTPYHIINGRKPTVKFSHMAPYHIVRDGENLDKIKKKVNEDEFINIFNIQVHEVGESSSRHVDSSNMHTLEHPLEQVLGNPSQPVRTRRQLDIDGEMCMFALTVSQAEPKNIKEAMADHAWIETMHEELHQFERPNVWELVDKPYCKNVINMKWLWKNKCDKENTVIRNKARLATKGISQKKENRLKESWHYFAH